MKNINKRFWYYKQLFRVHPKRATSLKQSNVWFMTPLPPSTTKDSNTIMNNCFRVERPPIPPNLTQFKPVHDEWPSNQTFETITYQKLRLSAPASDKFLPDQLPSGCRRLWHPPLHPLPGNWGEMCAIMVEIRAKNLALAEKKALRQMQAVADPVRQLGTVGEYARPPACNRWWR